MSFLSILKGVGKTLLGVEQVAAPIAEVLLPQYAPLIHIVDTSISGLQGSIVKQEIMNPTDNMGAAKSMAVTKDFEVSLQLFQDVLAKEGKKLIYDPAKLNSFIAAQVTAFNEGAELKDSLKIVPL